MKAGRINPNQAFRSINQKIVCGIVLFVSSDEENAKISIQSTEREPSGGIKKIYFF